jgi:hypothetical protein
MIGQRALEKLESLIRWLKNTTGYTRSKVNRARITVLKPKTDVAPAEKSRQFHGSKVGRFSPSKNKSLTSCWCLLLSRDTLTDYNGFP